VVDDEEPAEIKSCGRSCVFLASSGVENGDLISRCNGPHLVAPHKRKCLSMARSHPNPDVLTRAETAVYLRISDSKLTELLAVGGIPSYQLGRRRFFLRSALDTWTAASLSTAPVGGTAA
jgi:excisionase family DNA binding protein